MVIWNQNSPLGDGPDIAVIMPAGENHFYLNQPGAGFDYQNFIGSELVELTREMFPLSKHREDTYIGGLSMGGFGALNNGLKNPETFGGIIALSSASLSTNQFPDSDDSDNILGMKSFTEACSGFKRAILSLKKTSLKPISERMRKTITVQECIWPVVQMTF